MNTRSQLTKLRADLGKAKSDHIVQAISRVMDELGAAAAGGEVVTHTTLAEYFEPSQPTTDPEGNTL